MGCFVLLVIRGYLVTFFIVLIRRVTGSVACSFSFVVLLFLTADRVAV